jgi:hypothetical protein
MIRVILLGVLAFGTSSVGSAQEPAPPALQAEADRFASFWNAGDYAGLGTMMLPTGIRLRIPNEEHVSISVRQAQASLKEVMARNPGGDAQISRVFQGGSGPTGGFAEIPEPVIYTIFVGFTLKDEAWMVSEIRVFT